MKNALKSTALALALLVSGTSLGLAMGVETLQPAMAGPAVAPLLVADDDDDRPYWWRYGSQRWHGDDDWDDDDRWDDDDDDDDGDDDDD